MIAVRLKGGLGNQMFQYAAGRALALRHGVALKLDVSACLEREDRHYALESFSIIAEAASPEEVDSWLGRRRFLSRLMGKQAQGQSLCPVVEQGFRFDPKFALLADDVYLDGYWQSELYFNDYASQIRKDFKFRDSLEGRNAELATQMENCTAIAVHVRRGDYVSNAKTGAWHGVCTLNYYQQCIEQMKALCDNPVFYVFSDDLPWAVKNLPLPGDSVAVTGNRGAQAIIDMHLMSLCRHHIIANSSFSWWGAWLAEAPGQIVMAPEPWFRTKEVDASDLIPERWLRIELAD